MRADYRRWLEDQKYAQGTVTAQLHRAGRVEENYGSLDDHYGRDGLRSIFEQLSYSTEDERHNRPNPSKFRIEGNVRTNLASYKDAVVRYARFLAGKSGHSDEDFVQAQDLDTVVDQKPASVDIAEQKLSLERDMQAALRRNIISLGQSLVIFDDGAERSVETGFIDITCKDQQDNAIIVVELKAGRADSKAIGQILGYMSDLALEDDGRKVRGILVAHEFDKRAISAARIVPSLTLMRYSVEFRFESQE